MSRADKKYHQDFDFKHYYNFVPPFLQIFVEWVGKAIILGIFYGIALSIFHFHERNQSRK